MTHYKGNLRDIAFNLFEVNRLAERLAATPGGELDEATIRTVLDEVVRLAETQFAASFAAGDRNPPVFDAATHTVTLSPEMKASYAAVVDSGFTLVDLPLDLGGSGAPAAVRWAIAELLLGANPALYLYLSGYPWSAILWRIGNAQQKRIARMAIERGWGATMLLTEPDAGSDVGAGRTKAEEQPDGTWHITGVKRFITSGEHDLTENILHLVLARPVGAKPGTKGLSLFLVPKFMVDPESGALGERNGVFATNLEHKMGIRGSATCEMTFGAERPAVGWLVGDTHDGIAQMFEIIEYARMLVGTKAISTLSTGYLNALAYAKQRLQGADLLQTADKTAPRVPIVRHPDVRRLLMLQKSYAEGLRALIHYTAHWQDDLAAAERGDSRIDAGLAGEMNDLLLPIEPMGLKLSFVAGEGPVIENPVRTTHDVDSLSISNTDDLGYVGESIQLVSRALAGKTPVIGFVGAPFTVASYMIEGGASRHFLNVKKLMYNDETLWRRLMGKLVDVLGPFAIMQVAAGARAIQVFDSWVGALGADDYVRYVAPYSRALIERIRSAGVPVIHFGTGAGGFFRELHAAGGDVMGVDWRLNIDQAWMDISYRSAIQGNLDPAALFAPLHEIKAKVHELLKRTGTRPGHIFNLGHGILPETPVDHVKAVVQMVREFKP